MTQPSSFEESRSEQLKKLTTRLDIKQSDSVAIANINDMFDDAIQATIQFTGQTHPTKNMLIAAKKLAIIDYNQQGNEGETQRVEGSVTRSFSEVIPADIRNLLVADRVAGTRSFN